MNYRTLEDELRLGIDGTTDQDILLSPLLASKVHARICKMRGTTLSTLDICHEFDLGDDTNTWGKSTRETADIQFLLQLSK